ncbi:hypothetical protein JCM37172_13630 [Faecalimonas hominis]
MFFGHQVTYTVYEKNTRDLFCQLRKGGNPGSFQTEIISANTTVYGGKWKSIRNSEK